MNRHLLVATDGSTNAQRAIEYVADLYKGVSEVEVSLITVAPPLPLVLVEGGVSMSAESKRLQQLQEVERRRQEESEHILKQARIILERRGLPAEHIHVKPVLQSQGAVKDILFEARHGLYDALVMGRRGLGRLASYVVGSVSYGLVQQLHELAVWLIDAPLVSKRVLMAVDVCDPCLRVVDHVAHALSGVPGVSLTLFHVIPRFRPFLSAEETGSLAEIETVLARKTEERVRTLFEEAAAILVEAGFDHKAVDIRIKRGSAGVARDILTEYKKGKYDTLVVGRRGVGGWEAVFPGSVSNRLLHGLEEGVLWIIA